MALRDCTVEDGSSLGKYIYLIQRQVLGGDHSRRSSRVRRRIMGHRHRRGTLVAMRAAFSQIRITLSTSQYGLHIGEGLCNKTSYGAERNQMVWQEDLTICKDRGMHFGAGRFAHLTDRRYSSTGTGGGGRSSNTSSSKQHRERERATSSTESANGEGSGGSQVPGQHQHQWYVMANVAPYPSLEGGG
ncbi:hypothetical protein RRF57_012239 [Xylaria bambusicola]|uniref:Uncharacterized protein n=1 Tax=Xylaria bambusicola TaxID=326684 RepID=A0AAN7ZAS0_9PEZI